MKHQIRLDTPASKWDDGLFIGNGRLGASILGQPSEEVIPLNEESIWYGGPLCRDNPDGREHIEKIRELLRRGETEKAAFLAKIAMTSTPKYLSPYLPAGDLRIRFSGLQGEARHYRRVLDLDRALASVSFEMDGIAYKREYFVSRRRNVIAIRLTGGKPITLAANLNRRPYEEYTGKIDGRTAAIWGQCGADGVRYFGGVQIRATGGEAGTTGDFVTAYDASEVQLFISFGTDFMGRESFKEDCLARLDKAGELGFEALLAEHLRDWEALYNRVDFSLDTAAEEAETAALLQKQRDGGDEQALCETLFHFGRYLLMSSSLSCQLPATLQGIWNGSFTPPWESKYTININTEMNYWLAEVCNLPEACLPLFDLVERMAVRGKETARNLYGCGGFVAHHNTNLWADTGVEGIFDSSPIWPMGGAWLSLHLFEHYRYTGDLSFLKERALPVLEGAVTFFTEYLTPGRDGTLVSGPSISPENSYRSAAGETGALCMAPTMDSQILRELFSSYLAACGALHIESELTQKAADILSRLPKTEVSSDGRIKEWQEEYEELEPGHRHVSHLFGLYPGSQITRETPDLFEAAGKTLRRRLENGGGHTGWSCVWIICFYARLGEGALCRKYLRQLLSRSIQENLLDSHPPFQIDGNLGVTAAMTEMLCQSHNAYIELLPALPENWKSGKLTGVRLRGNIGLDLYWADGKLQKAVFLAAEDGEKEVRLGGKSCTAPMEAGTPLTLTAADFA